jgi:hypothetical protein
LRFAAASRSALRLALILSLSKDELLAPERQP